MIFILLMKPQSTFEERSILCLLCTHLERTLVRGRAPIFHRLHLGLLGASRVMNKYAYSDVRYNRDATIIDFIKESDVVSTSKWWLGFGPVSVGRRILNFHHQVYTVATIMLHIGVLTVIPRVKMNSDWMRYILDSHPSWLIDASGFWLYASKFLQRFSMHLTESIARLLVFIYKGHLLFTEYAVAVYNYETLLFFAHSVLEHGMCLRMGWHCELNTVLFSQFMWRYFWVVLRISICIQLMQPEFGVLAILTIAHSGTPRYTFPVFYQLTTALHAILCYK